MNGFGVATLPPLKYLQKKQMKTNKLVSLRKLESISTKWGVLIILSAFLLGRAFILNGMSPFALAFFVSVFVMKREMMGRAFLALIAGAALSSIEQGIYVFLAIGIFFLLNAITSRIPKFTSKLFTYQVCLSIIFARIYTNYIFLQDFGFYTNMLAVVEGILGFILLNIFYQSVPLLTTQKFRASLQSEEMVSLGILFACLLTGTMGWVVSDLSITHIFSRFIILVFAYAAGATVGATFGVVIGLVLSLVHIDSLLQMSVLSFAGLLGGLLKEAKKIGVCLGLLVSTALLGLYGGNDAALLTTLYESMIACVLFFLLPKSVTTAISKKIPGTFEYVVEQENYSQKMKELTAEKILKYAHTFKTLAQSFEKYLVTHEGQEREFDQFVYMVAEKTCSNCQNRKMCWGEKREQTKNFMRDVMGVCMYGKTDTIEMHHWEWQKHCNYVSQVHKTVEQYYVYYEANSRLKEQIRENRKIVAEQLSGVSKVMDDFSQEIKRNRESYDLLEEEIVESLRQSGIDIKETEIFSLDKGSVDIEIYIPSTCNHGEGEKIIAPMLSSILKDNIVVKKEERGLSPKSFHKLTLGSLESYKVEYGVTYVAKDGGFVNGDSYTAVQLDRRKFVLAISDGMGNGARAHDESKETLELLDTILNLGIDEEVAIKSINSVLALRTTDEMYSTLDLAVIDLNDAKAKFLKIGSMPSYIKRGDQVIKVQANNLPMGVLPEFEFDTIEEELKSGDYLIMMSDGIFEGPREVENYDLWMQRKIREIHFTDPQIFSDQILEEVIRSRGYIHDDMTVVVLKIEKNMPKWATIPIYPKAL